MNNEIIQQNQQDIQAIQSFQQNQPLSMGINAGSVSIEMARAIAEVREAIKTAKLFPRDLTRAYAEVMEACKIPSMAKIAFYSLPRGGKTVTGPSIHLIQQIATSMDHFEWGHRELSRMSPTADEPGKSEIEVYAWDKQKNIVSKRQITVLHVIDTKEGPRRLRDQTEIDNLIANKASKQMRGRLKAIIPQWLTQAAEDECRKTLLGENQEPVSERIKKMIQAFAGIGVNVEKLTRYLGHPLAETMPEELIELIGIFNSIKEGTPASEFFSAEIQAEKSEKTASALSETAAQGKANATAATKATSAVKTEPKTTAKAAESTTTKASTVKEEPKQKPEPEKKEQPAETVAVENGAEQAEQSAQQENVVEESGAAEVQKSGDDEDLF